MRHNKIIVWLPRGTRLLLLASFLLLQTSVTATAGPAYRPQAAYQSLRFYGHNSGDVDRVKIPIDPSVPADVGGDFTLEFWMRALPGDNGSGACVAGGSNWINGNIMFDRDVYGNGDNGDYGVSLAAGRIAYGVAVSASSNTICGGTDVADNVWHHVAVTRDGATGQLRIYVDGNQDGFDSGPTGDMSYRDGRPTSYPNDPYLVIGAEKHNLVSYLPYNGYVDEVRISNMVRYTAPFARPTAAFSPDANTVALYHFNEGSAGPCTGTVIDSSGAPGGPSNGTCRYGGSGTSGPVYSVDAPVAVTLAAFHTRPPAEGGGWGLTLAVLFIASAGMALYWRRR